MTDHKFCQNCEAPLHGAYCHQCGQSSQSSFRFLAGVLKDLLDDLISYDSRVNRTLIPLLIKPGYVIERYLQGRRVYFLPPFRLYLFVSLVFFLLLPLTNYENTQSSSVSVVESSVVDNNDAQNAIKNNKPPEIQEVVGAFEEFDISFFGRDFNRVVKDKVVDIMLHKRQEFGSAVLNSLPSILFILLPVLALLLKGLYMFSSRYYMEHIVVVLYSQSFIFIMLLIVLFMEKGQYLLAVTYPRFTWLHVAGEGLVLLARLWIPVYLYLTLKRIYRQSLWLVTLKYVSLSVAYGAIFLLLLLAAVIWNAIHI